MTSPTADSFESTGVWEYREVVTKPTIVAGFHCPASFIAEGLGPTIRFSIALNQSTGIYVDHVEVDFENQAPASYAIPLTRLTEHAINAAGRLGLQLPQGFSGFVPSVGATVEVGANEWFVVPLESRPLTKKDREKIATRDLLAPAPRKPKVNSIPDSVLRKVAKAHKGAKWGEKEDAVRSVIGEASDSTVRDYIRKARERGFLADVADEDRRKTRRKK